MPKVNYIQASKTNWIGEFDHQFPGIEYVNMGSLQRIARATELMANNYLEMQKEIERLKENRDMYLGWYNKSKHELNKRDRQIAALKGVITKMKKQKSKTQTLVLRNN